MPRKKGYIGIIESIYRWAFDDISLYFWVEAQRSIVPAITIEQAIYSYFKYLCIEDFNIESAIATYSRLKKQFYKPNK